MAIGKWIGFGATTNQNAATTVDDVKAAQISGAEYKQFGLENFGNTCYANSVLQALYFCHPFRELVIHAPDSSIPSVQGNFVPPSPQPPPPQPTHVRIKNNRKLSTPDVRPGADAAANGSAPPTGPPIPPTPPTLFSALRSLFLHISSNVLDKGTVSPRAFVEKLKKENELFRGNQHQDAHEFLNYLLNKIAEDLEEEAKGGSRTSSGEDLSTSTSSTGAPSASATMNSRSNSTTHIGAHHAATLVHNLFEGVLTSETRCLTCETVSSRDESFLDLSIDIEQNSSVTACLRQFSASEMLCQRNKFFCDSCCGLQEAEKRMKIKKLPNVLALHLKRFKYQEDVQKYIKLAYRVAFPLELRLFNTVDDAPDPDRLYELFAIVIHIGNGPHHGHYVTIVKSRGSWMVFDDDTVESVKENDIPKYFGDSNSGSAYVLYYQAVDLDLTALGLRPTEPTVDSAPASPPLAAPPFPPGLMAEEGDSDISDAPVPVIPSSPVKVTQPIKVPVLSVTIPPPEPSPPPQPPAATPTATSPSHKSGGFFNSLRHSPSIRTVGAGINRQPIHSPSVTQPLPSASSSKATSEVSDTTPLASPLPATNRRIKGPKEKSSGWFSKRRSMKISDSTVISVPPSAFPDRATSASDDASIVASSKSSRTTSLLDDPGGPLSAAPALETPQREQSTSTSSEGKHPAHEGLNGMMAPSVSSTASISVGSPTNLSTSLPTNSPSSSPPPIPPISPHRPRPGHDGSQPMNSAHGKPSVGQIHRRPSTAGASSASPRQSELPAKSGAHTSPEPPPSSKSQTHTTVTDKPHERQARADGPPHRPGSDNTAAPTSNSKRPPRKMSLLGFVRKDRDKHKDKDKDRDHSHPNTSSGAGVAIAQMSAIGRI